MLIDLYKQLPGSHNFWAREFYFILDMNFRTYFLSFALIILSFTGISQETKERNKKNPMPDIPGYIILKGDFHLHTVFSDGHVWPTFRVREAQRDGLDVISLTEHIDYEGFPEELEYYRDKAYEIAVKQAEKTDVLVIRGMEISPRVPPYHNNAIFLKMLTPFPTIIWKRPIKSSS